jgi:hypothetical protein
MLNNKRNSAHRIVLPAVCLAMFFWASTTALDGDESHAHGADQTYHRQYAMGTMGAYEYAVGEHEEAHLGGWGLFFELGLVPHLELEFLVKLMGGKELMSVPIDILLKVPFHPIPEVHPFIGFGPTVAFAMNAEEMKVHYGGVVAAGSHFWASKGFGFLVEASYTLAYGHSLIHDIVGAAGLVARW